MGDQGPTEGNPFEGIPFLNDLAKMFQSPGAVSWDTARQFAIQIATAGQSEDNPDPVERIRLEELTRVADLHVTDVTGLALSTTGRVVQLVPVTKATWAARTIDAWRPLLERLSQSLTSTADPAPDEADDPVTQLLQGFSTAFGPLLFGMQAGGMVGHLAARALGQYDLPIPRPPSDELAVVSSNLNEFGAAWDVPPDDLRLWLCVSELATHAVLSIPHVRSVIRQCCSAPSRAPSSGSCSPASKRCWPRWSATSTGWSTAWASASSGRTTC
ncbi:MAG: zinc-dependent metalloprotease [Acidobacteria bacterium]|nr:zinc-dependent metalloprotease [Acidobacteriota bacterium]